MLFSNGALGSGEEQNLEAKKTHDVRINQQSTYKQRNQQINQQKQQIVHETAIYRQLPKLMKVSLAVVLSLWCAESVTAQQIRGSSPITNDAGDVSVRDTGHGLLRHANLGDEEKKKKTVIISRELGKRGPRALHWARAQRTRNKRNVASSNSESKKEKKKTVAKKTSQDAEYYSWGARYREWVNQWRKQQRKKGEAEDIRYYESNSGVFNIRLPLFSSKIAYGYTNYKNKIKNVDRLKRDVDEALQFKVKLFLEQKQYVYRDKDAEPLPALGVPENNNGASPSADNVDDFGTNTVEENVDEGDFLKVSEDGKFAFAVFGANIVWWDVDKGNETATTVPLPTVDVEYEPPPGPIPRPLPAQVLRAPQVLEEEGEGGNRDLQFVPDSLYYCWGPVVPTIHSLMVYKKRLVVVASGYQQSILEKLDYTPSFYEAFDTKILIYDFAPLYSQGELQLVKETDVHGRFDSIRAIGGRAHLVTFSGLNTYTYIEEPLSRNQAEFKDMDDREYRKAARRLAKHKLIPRFNDRLIEDISGSGEVSDVARIAMWTKEASPGGEIEEQVFSQGVMQYYAQVTSFDMLDPSPPKELSITQAGAFMPTSYGHTYATEKMLILAGQGWDWVGGFGASRQTTYFLGFALLDNGRAVPAAVGSLEGHLINPFAIDIVNGYMRVAVTIRNNNWWFAETTGEVNTPPPTQNFVKVLKIPDIDDTEFDGNGPVLEVVGSTKSLGKENEVFTGVRFGDKIAYVITFFQTDPLYVISFKNETSPQVLGELEITGFSRYLHFVNDANTLVLGVGQEANAEGRVLGLQVSLYNATVPTMPNITDRYSFELHEQGVSSSSTAEFDYKAFRYVKLGDEEGILIIPFRVNDYRSAVLREAGDEKEKDDPEEDLNYNGFALLDVSRDGISERFRIPHTHPLYYRLGCYQSVELAERSFVVDGNVTTLKGHSIHKYQLDSKELLDSIELDPLED